MSLLDLVKQDHRVWPAADRLGQLTTRFVADIARGRTDQTSHRVLFAVFGHVDPDHGALVIEQEVSQGLGQLRLADTGRTQEQERTRGAVGVGNPGARTADSVRHGLNGLLLADEPLADVLFGVQQLLAFTFQQTAGGNARPRRHDFGDVVGRNLLAHHLLGLAGCRFGFFCRGDLLFDLRDFAVQQARSRFEVRVAARDLSLAAQIVEFLPQFAQAVQTRTL